MQYFSTQKRSKPLDILQVTIICVCPGVSSIVSAQRCIDDIDSADFCGVLALHKNAPDMAIQNMTR